MDRKLSIN